MLRNYLEFRHISTLSNTISKSTVINSVRNKSGEILEDLKQVHDRLEEHFSELPNTACPYNENMLNDLPELPLLSVLDYQPPPSSEEVSTTIRKLRNGKGPGCDGVPP